MRVALVTSEYVTEPSGDGGLAGYLYRIAVILKDMGYSPVVLVASDHNEQFMHEGVEVRRVMARHRVIDWIDCLTRHWLPLDWLWQSWVLNRAVIRAEREQPFNVIHFSSYMAVGLFRRSRTPAVIRLSSLQRMLHEANEVPRRFRERLAEKLELWALTRGDLLFAPSKLLADRVTALTGRAVQVLESPWMPSGTAPDPTLYQQQLAGKNYLLYFGTLNVLKGLPALAEALPQILEESPELHFVAVGKQRHYRGLPMSDYIRKCAGRHADRVHYLGKQGRPRLDPVIDHAQAVVLPSRLDNLSNACIEAMAHGKIVVATHGASFEQLIDDGKSGLLCKIDDPDDLRNVLRRLLQMSQEQRHAMGERAKARVKLLHPDIVASQLVRFYREANKKCAVEKL